MCMQMPTCIPFHANIYMHTITCKQLHVYLIDPTDVRILVCCNGYLCSEFTKKKTTKKSKKLVKEEPDSSEEDKGSEEGALQPTCM